MKKLANGNASIQTSKSIQKSINETGFPKSEIFTQKLTSLS
jgi:hypothetical protein